MRCQEDFGPQKFVDSSQVCVMGVDLHPETQNWPFLTGTVAAPPI
jgi:hypothetical protein